MDNTDDAATQIILYSGIGTLVFLTRICFLRCNANSGDLHKLVMALELMICDQRRRILCSKQKSNNAPCDEDIQSITDSEKRRIRPMILWNLFFVVASFGVDALVILCLVPMFSQASDSRNVVERAFSEASHSRTLSRVALSAYALLLVISIIMTWSAYSTMKVFIERNLCSVLTRGVASYLSMTLSSLQRKRNVPANKATPQPLTQPRAKNLKPTRSEWEILRQNDKDAKSVGKQAAPLLNLPA